MTTEKNRQNDKPHIVKERLECPDLAATSPTTRTDATRGGLERQSGVLQTLAANHMPAPTWGWLKMNGARIELPEGLRTAPQGVELELDGVRFGKPHALDQALRDAAGNYRHLRRVSAPGDAAARKRAAQDAAHGAEEALDVPALSTYQEGAIAVEEAYTPELAFETGMGEEAAAYLRSVAGPLGSFVVMPGARARATIRVNGTVNTATVAATDLIVANDAELDLVIALDGLASDSAGNGLVGSTLRIFAGAGAHVTVTNVQTADDAFIALDDTGLFLEGDARVQVRHVVLGSGRSYTGLAAELAGDAAKIAVDTSYLGTRAQERDFNYEIRHRGRTTESELNANGVLAGASVKCLRGTIDLVHGCKGSTGSEQETVLIADDRVKNKTVPVILCDEDDVAGNHGATIGHVRPDQLFYLESRGLSPEDAEALFLRAKLEDAAINAPDEHIRASIVRLARQLVSDFEILEEETA